MIPLTSTEVSGVKSQMTDCNCGAMTVPADANKPSDLPISMPPSTPAANSSTSHSSYLHQFAARTAMKKLKYKFFAAIILGIGAILGAIALTYIGLFYWRTAPLEQQVFQIVLHDKTEQQKIYLDIKVDPREQLEYTTSPQEGGNKAIIGLKDFKKGIEAFKQEGASKCYIGKIMPDAKLQTYENGSIQEANVEDNQTYVVLNQTIHPFVLRLAAGDRIVEFCGPGDAIWMIPIEDALTGTEQHVTSTTDHSISTEEDHSRQKRWGCWYCGRSYYTTCWWDCNWWGWKKWCTKRCYY